jgi:hypothetical protein
MKIKSNNIEFVSFSDGICDIYSEDEEGNITDKYNRLGFSNRILGFKRYFTAAANQVNVNKVIRVPQVPNIDNHDTLKIKGLGKFSIELVQTINDTNPKCIDLTLKQLEMHR